MLLSIFKFCSEVGIIAFPPTHHFSPGLHGKSVRQGASTSQNSDVPSQPPHWLPTAFGRRDEITTSSLISLAAILWR